MSDRYAHFIGVGGAGMSGIAKVLHERGVVVSGSDLKDSPYSRVLREAGVPVAIGHDAANLGDPEVVVISSAIPQWNPELVEAQRRGIPIWPRAKMLAHVATGRTTVAVAGTHGKTTTSSMIATMAIGLHMDPTFLIGGELNEMGANARCGNGDLCVVEADESDGSFLFVAPHVAVVTNVEADHLDHYADLAAVRAAFEAFLKNVSPDGKVVVWGEDSRLVTLARSASRSSVMTYGFSERVDVRCSRPQVDGIGQTFSVTCGDQCAKCTLRVPGEHNVLNATAALAVAVVLGLELEAAAEALGSFGGVRRRFDHVGHFGGVTVVDDYAHHPTEVQATLAAARRAGARRIWSVFQPHRYSRTRALGSDFGGAFELADRIVLMDVYGAGEAPIPGVSGKTILDALLAHSPRARAAYFPHRPDLVPFVASRVRPGDLVLTMGAGDVTTLGPELLRVLGERADGGASRCR